jgi:hypothetical protein
MPTRYALYKTCCVLNAILLGLMILDIIYLICSSDMLLNNEPAEMLLLLFFLFIYAACVYWGFRLLIKYRSGDGISKASVQSIVVFFIIQLCFQIYFAITLPAEIGKTLDTYYYVELWQAYDYELIILISALSLLFVSTAYVQFFTFPLLNAVKRKHNDLLKQLDDIGS